MMFSTNTPIPFTVRDLKKHLDYMDDNMVIRLANSKNQYLSLVGGNYAEVAFCFSDKNYFTGWDFENNCEK